MERSRPDHLVFPIVVWGKAYVRTFLDLALPTFLCPGNLPYCSKNIHTKIILLTSQDDKEMIEASNRFHYAKSICDTEIRPIITRNILALHNKYGVMASLHHSIVKEYEGTNSIISILSPDSIISENCLKFALNKIFDGYSAVLVAGPRAALQSFEKSINFTENDNILCLAPRKIVSEVRHNFHAISKSVIFSERNFTTIPSCFYWISGDDSFIAKYFHLHPLMVRINKDTIFSKDHTGTVDATLVNDASVEKSSTYVVEDSDQLVIAELSNENSMDIPTKRRFCKSFFIYNWAKFNALPNHIENYKKYIFLFRGESTSSNEINESVSCMKRQTFLINKLLRFL